MADEATRVTYKKVLFEHFSMYICFLVTADGVYVAISEICAALGLITQTETRRLRGSTFYPPYLRELVLLTARGARKGWCIKKAAFARWMGDIDVERVTPSMRPDLANFQFALLEAADRIMFGDDPDVVARVEEIEMPGIGHVRFDTPVRGQLYFNCPACHQPLCLAFDDGRAHLLVGEEV